MKRKLIEAVPPKKLKSKETGKVVTAQIVGDTMVLNIWFRKRLQWRYCIRESGEYECWDDGEWRREKLRHILGGGIYYISKTVNATKFDTKNDEKTANEWVTKCHSGGYWYPMIWDRIDFMEQDYCWEYAMRKEQRRKDRLYDLMLNIPEAPDDMTEWMLERIGNPDYAFWDAEEERWGLTCCGKYRKRIGKGKVKHLDKVTCPVCKKQLTVMKRKTSVVRTERVLLFDNSPIGGVMRYFAYEIEWKETWRHIIRQENVRILLAPEYRNRPVYRWDGDIFDNKHNTRQLRDYNYPTWIYARDTEAAVGGTLWEDWGKILAEMHGFRTTYDAWMMSGKSPNVLEYLAKGRFCRLLEETGPYSGLNDEGKTIEEVFRIKDRQKINRIRDRNGGKRMLLWMQWADRCHKKIPDSFLSWTEKEHILPDEGRWLFLKLSPEAAMNYIERQKRESYKGSSAKTVISQYEDYMGMCQRLDKDLADEMVVKPRELKRRHDEAVKEIEFREAELDAKKYSDRFPEAEKVLTEVKDNLEYQGEEYRITVPRRIIDIVAEGRVLHHCAGATDRYFDRIASHETYIVFLRKNAEPEMPYYTVEVEPGGTIRQHRGMYDEEPDIEKVKPFLREWQKEIKKRMKAKDRERAKISAIKREENIKDLKAKNNTRVLQGLMEDFMEAI